MGSFYYINDQMLVLQMVIFAAIILIICNKRWSNSETYSKLLPPTVKLPFKPQMVNIILELWALIFHIRGRKSWWERSPLKLVSPGAMISIILQPHLISLPPLLEADIYFKSQAMNLTQNIQIVWGLGLICHHWSSYLVFSLTLGDREQLVNLVWAASHWALPCRKKDSTSHASAQVTSQSGVHCNVISPWAASHIKQRPPPGEGEHFISYWHIHLYPCHSIEGLLGLKEDLKLFPESNFF